MERPGDAKLELDEAALLNEGECRAEVVELERERRQRVTGACSP
jgi:hypothetical protein